MSIATIPRPQHDEDFHAWALDQAERLRAFARSRPNEPIDWELVAEEVEGMGISDRRACESFLQHIITHLLKVQFAADPTPARHWQKEVAAFRLNLEQRLTPSIERQLRADLDRHWRYARRSAVIQMHDADPTFGERLPRARAYDFERIVGDWLPERGA
jgi:hypothetical protein